MIAIGILRCVSTVIHGTRDETWTAFWVNIEASIAVFTVGAAAWRTFYLEIQSDQPRNDPRNRARARFFQLPRWNCWPRKDQSASSDIELQQLPAVDHSNGTGSRQHRSELRRSKLEYGQEHKWYRI